MVGFGGDERVLVWAGAPVPIFHPTRAEVRTTVEELTRQTAIFPSPRPGRWKLGMSNGPSARTFKPRGRVLDARCRPTLTVSVEQPTVPSVSSADGRSPSFARILASATIGRM